MSLKTRITQLFGKKGSGSTFALTLSQSALDLCIADATHAEKLAFFNYPLGSETALEVLKLALSEHKLAGRCQIMLAPPLYQIVQVDKPAVADEEIVSALRWQVKDLVPIGPDDMLLDYYESPVQVSNNNKISVVCAQLSQIKPITDCLFDLDIQIAGITSLEFAFANLLYQSEEAKLLICQQPNAELLILIVKQGQIYFARQLRGHSQIGNKTEQELGFGVIDALSLEVQRSIDYFERQLKQAPVKGIYTLLPVALEATIAQLLAQNTLVPVQPLVVNQLHSDQRGFAACLGALLEISSIESVGAADEITH